jgi:hypothetical protein
MTALQRNAEPIEQERTAPESGAASVKPSFASSQRTTSSSPASPQRFAEKTTCAELDAFATLLKVDAASLRQDVQTAASHALNTVAIAAADGKRILKILSKAEQAARQVSRLDPARVAQDTVAKIGGTDKVIEIGIRQARELSATLREMQAQRDYLRLSAGGGSPANQFATKLIERLALIWTRHTNQPTPGGASGKFVNFTVAAWVDCSLPEFIGRNGEPQPLADALGSRVAKFHLRHNRDEKNARLGTKRSVPKRASSPSSKRR